MNGRLAAKHRGCSWVSDFNEGIAAFSPLQRLMLRMLGRTHFVRLLAARKAND